MRFLEAVRGQARAKEILARSLERGRFAPALVLTGPPGVGRSLFARELAKALVCPASGEARPCGTCGACRRVEAGSHPDVVVVGPDPERASLTVPIEAVRAALEEMALAPVEAGCRVFIFDPADAMLEESMNALLKALEEPPPRAHLVLVASREGALLDTIGSRCLVVGLGPLDAAAVRDLLVARGVAAGELDRRVAWSQGSPGRALDPDLLACAGAAEKLLDALSSGGSRRDPIGVAMDLVDATGGKASETKDRRARALLILDGVALGLRDAACARVGRDDGLSGAPAATIERLARTAPTDDALARSIELVEQAALAIEENKHVTLTLEGLVIELGQALAASPSGPPGVTTSR